MTILPIHGLLLHIFRYPKIVDNSTLPVLQQWLARDKSAQGKHFLIPPQELKNASGYENCLIVHVDLQNEYLFSSDETNRSFFVVSYHKW